MRTLPFTFSEARGIGGLITITLNDGSFLRFTTTEADVTISGNIWKASAGVNLTQVQFSADGTPSSADIRLMAVSGTSVRPGMAALGYFDGLQISIVMYDTGNLAAGTYDMIPNAIIGSAQEDTHGVVTLAVQGPLAYLDEPMCQSYTVTCKSALGDDRCKIPLDVPDVARGTAYTAYSGPHGNIYKPWQTNVRKKEGGLYNDLVYRCTTSGTTHASVAPTYPTVIGGTVTDGTAVFTARQAWLCGATGSGIDFFNIQLTNNPTIDIYGGDPDVVGGRPNSVNWTLGNIIPRSGPMTGIKLPIRAYDDGSFIVTLWEPVAASNFPASTTFELHPGCDGLLNTCIYTFDNVRNMRATPYCPPTNLITGRA